MNPNLSGPRRSPTLILTPRFTVDSQALWQAAIALGWGVERLTSWRIDPELRSVAEPVPYLEGLFGPTLAADLGLRLSEPPLDWLPRLPREYSARRVELMSMAAARALTAPAFVKPPNDKSFPAMVVATGAALPSDVPADAPVLVSEVVSWETEFRCFVLDRRVRTFSVYLRRGVLQREAGFVHTAAEATAVSEFMARLLADARIEVPKAAVIDVGVIEGRGWAVVEQNAAWASGLYGCEPTAVLEVLRHASSRL